MGQTAARPPTIPGTTPFGYRTLDMSDITEFSAVRAILSFAEGWVSQILRVNMDSLYKGEVIAVIVVRRALEAVRIKSFNAVETRTLSLLAGLGMALMICGCGGNASSNGVSEPSLVSLSVSPSNLSVFTGESKQLTATGTFSDESTQNLSTAVAWSSANTQVAMVSSTGLVTAQGGGLAAITATSGSISAQASVSVTYQGVLTYRNDLGRTGQNLNEVALTSANVNSAQFGKLFSYPVDGAIYAQPLYVASVAILGQGVHNVVYVATQHDSVYAFDADGKTTAPLWHVSFINASTRVTSVPGPDVSDYAIPGGEIGVTATPVIDAIGGTLFVVAYTKENGQYVYRLHALDLTSGAEKFGGPVVIQASVPGTGDENNGQGQVPFDPKMHLQRPGLLLLSGVVYIGFGSHDDTPPWHGWLLAYNATTLQQVASFNTTPNGSAGSIWESGCAPAVDANGNVYVATSNGTFDVNTGGMDYGESVLKLNPGTLSVLDWFSPLNLQILLGDWDLGSGGTMLLPDQPGSHPHLLVVAGKQGVIYLIDRDNLGHFNSVSDQIVQELEGTINNNNLSTPAYWQGSVYYASENDNLKMFALNNGLLSTAPVSASRESFGYAGASPSISANGSRNGILWVIDTSALGTGGPAVLRAYDATNVSHELYNSAQAGTRDTLGPSVKFTVPTVINGKVYAGTATELDVFGVLPQ